jgi:outer membrane protein assembly factor BamD (BamD/ComL family)
MRSFYFGSFSTISVFFSWLALAANTSPAPPPNLIPIDQLQSDLYKNYRSKPAKNLKLAYQALKSQKYTQAIKQASKVIGNQEFSDFAHWITASAYKGLAKEQVDSKAYSKSIQSAKKAADHILKIERDSPYAPFIRTLPKELSQIEILMGDGYWGTRQWKLAGQNFEKAFQRYQSQNLLVLVTPENLNHYAEACKKKQSPLCLGWLQKFTVLFIKKSEEIRAISTYFPELAEKAKPIRGVSKVTVGYRAPDLDQAAYENAMKLYYDEKFSQASKSLRQFLDDFPRSAHRYRAKYWLAQALTHEQEHEKAHKMYEDLQLETPLSYYGLLASNGSGKSIDTSIEETIPLASESDPALLPQEIHHLERAKRLLAENANELAALELKDFRARDVHSSPFLVYLAMLHQNSKNYGLCFQTLGELIQRGYSGIISSYSLKMIFPLDFFETVKKYALENKLDPILVLSLIKQESAFDKDANSSVGAMGLMQLMPATASDTDPKISIANLIDPDENIRVGTKYLSKLLTRFNGNIVLALAGYNAGPNAADRWMRDTPVKRGMLEFIEGIPYKETREYVSSILRNYFWYSRRIDGISPKSLNYFWNVYGPPENPNKLPVDTQVKTD